MPAPQRDILPESAEPSTAPDVSLTGLGGRLGSRLFGSRLSLLLLLPGLMLLAGIGFVATGQIGLRRSIETALHQRVDDQTANVAREAVTCLEQGQPLLVALCDRVLARRPEDRQSGPDQAAFAGFLRTLARARPGVAYASFAGVDGSFRGVFVDHEHGGALRFNESEIAADGHTVRHLYAFTPEGGLSMIETRLDTGYDPRKRPFWAPAVAAHEPVWTAPYQFFLTRQTGITCAVALRDPASGELLGVASIDFDLSTLSEVMGQIAASGPAGGVAFLFSADGTRLASSARLDDPAATVEAKSTYETASAALPAADATAFFDLVTARGELLVGVRGIQVPGGPLWFAGTRAPRASLASTIEDELRRTFWVGLAGLAIAVGLAVLLANHISRQKRLANVARAAADAAQAKLRAMGSYTLVKELGAGGMGAVWKAEHQLLARPAALKLILLDRIGANPAERALALKRFEREAKATARLRSRNTITLYDYGVAADCSFYYAMELLDGLDLDRVVATYGPQPAGRVVQILLQACNSLAEAHANGMVHRDIKPANIYLCRLGLEVDVIKVLDFGLVAERNASDAQLTGVGMIAGTPAFMAPEQARGETLDGRADLYALGCVAYWLLTGRMVFSRQDSMAVLLAHINEAPAPLGELGIPGLPPDLDELIMTMLAKRPDERPPDALTVIDALRAIRIPDGQRWTQPMAEAWWRQHRPPGADPAAPATSKEAITVMEVRV